MTFIQLYNLIHESAYLSRPKFDSYISDDNGKSFNIGRRTTHDDININIDSLPNIKTSIDGMLHNYGFRIKNFSQLNHDLSNQNSIMLFRGHKTLNPFVKDIDTKSPGNTVFWAKQPENAYTFAIPTNTGGTRGRHMSNILHKIYGNYSGYISIAYPKDPRRLTWYVDFGVEKAAIQRQKDIKKAKDLHNQNSPHLTFNGISEPSDEENTYKMNDDTGYKRAETALGPSDITKLKTFIFLKDYSGLNFTLLNVAQIKKIAPELYNLLNTDSPVEL